MTQVPQTSRTKSLIMRSAVVTQALKLNEAKVGPETYRELQALESKAVAAGATFEIARADLFAAQVKRDEAEQELSILNSASLLICKLRGVAASLFEEVDRGDPVGLAQHLEDPVSRVQTIGPVMAQMLRDQRMLLSRLTLAIEPEATRATKAQDDLNSVHYRLESVIAMARSLLASNGVLVKFPSKPRTVKRKSGAPGAVPPAPAVANSTPKNGAAEHALTESSIGGAPGPS